MEDFLNRPGNPAGDDGFTAQKNFLLNVVEYVRRQIPPAWAGALHGLPAFVCGSGSSLEATAATVAPFVDRGVVFAADSTLPGLAREGLVADFAVSLSPHRPPELCLIPGAEPARVILSTVSPASWREVIAHDRRFFLSHAHPTEDWLVEQGMATTSVVASDDCDLAGLELARHLGCAPIHLIGFDFSTNDSDRALAIAGLLATWPEDLVVQVNDHPDAMSHTRRVPPHQFAPSPGTVAKRPALARLAAPVTENPENVRAALAALGAEGALGCRALPGLRFVLEQRGPGPLVGELKTLFRRTDFARALGSLSQALAPHLVAPRADSVAFWQAALDQIEEICCLAESVYGVPVA